MPFTVLDCTRDQLIADVGEYESATGFDRSEPSWDDLAAADEIVPDDVIFDHFDGYVFTDDDFIN